MYLRYLSNVSKSVLPLNDMKDKANKRKCGFLYKYWIFNSKLNEGIKAKKKSIQNNKGSQAKKIDAKNI